MKPMNEEGTVWYTRMVVPGAWDEMYGIPMCIFRSSSLFNFSTEMLLDR